MSSGVSKIYQAGRKRWTVCPVCKQGGSKPNIHLRDAHGWVLVNGKALPPEQAATAKLLVNTPHIAYNGQVPSEPKLAEEVAGRVSHQFGDAGDWVIVPIDPTEKWHGILRPKSTKLYKSGQEDDFWIFGTRSSGELLLSDSDFGRFPISDRMKPRYIQALEETLQFTQDKKIDPAHLSELKGMFNRCIRKDQWDWLAVYDAFERPTLDAMRRIVRDIVAAIQSLKENNSKLLLTVARLRPLTPMLMKALAQIKGNEVKTKTVPQRRRTKTIVICEGEVRDSKIIQELKELYEGACQICERVMETPTGRYSEGAHIRPFAAPHNGPDLKSNILNLCPWCHKGIDHGAIILSNDLCELKLNKHPVDIAHVQYLRNLVQNKKAAGA